MMLSSPIVATSNLVRWVSVPTLSGRVTEWVIVASFMRVPSAFRALIGRLIGFLGIWSCSTSFLLMREVSAPESMRALTGVSC